MIREAADRVSVFGLDVDRVTLAQAVEQLNAWMQTGERRCRYVVTPNLDHVVQFERYQDLRSAYQSASMVVADGWPLVTASRLFKDSPLPERVAGSDLVPALLSSAHKVNGGRTVFLLGAASGVGELAAAKIETQWPSVSVSGTYSPPVGFENDAAECRKVTQSAASASAAERGQRGATHRTLLTVNAAAQQTARPAVRSSVVLIGSISTTTRV